MNLSWYLKHSSQTRSVYTYTGEITPKGDANIELGNGIAYLKDFVQINNTVDFRFEYGENLGMFCNREEHPPP